VSLGSAQTTPRSPLGASGIGQPGRAGRTGIKKGAEGADMAWEEHGELFMNHV